MSKRLKTMMVDELRRGYEGAEHCVVVDVHRAGGEESVALRRYLAERGVRLRTVRNSIAVRALAELGMGEVERYLRGPCALASGGEDLLSLARALVDCAREHQVVELRGAVCEGQPLEAERVKELAGIGSLEALLAAVVGVLQAPLRQVVGTVAAPLSGLASVVKQAAELSEG